MHFATHGAIACDVKGIAEPGLILTPPMAEEGTEDDDGYPGCACLACVRAWSFVKSRGWGRGTPTRIKLLGDFRPGRIYELTYAARDPMIVGLGMAGIRDLLSYLRANPLTGVPAPQRTLIFGISQSARLLQTMLLRGLHIDEAGRPVFDGAFLHVAGAGKPWRNRNALPASAAVAGLLLDGASLTWDRIAMLPRLLTS